MTLQGREDNDNIPEEADFSFERPFPGEWYPIPDFCLPVTDQNRDIMKVLGEYIARGIRTRTDFYNRNFDFRVNDDGVLEVREKDAREDITRKAVDVGLIYERIRQRIEIVMCTRQGPPEKRPPEFDSNSPIQELPSWYVELEKAQMDSSRSRQTKQLGQGLRKYLAQLLPRLFITKSMLSPPPLSAEDIRLEMRRKTYVGFRRFTQITQLQKLTDWMKRHSNQLEQNTASVMPQHRPKTT